jgi:hypothetical protein
VTPSGLPILGQNDAQVAHHRLTFASLTDGFATMVGGWPAITTRSGGAGAELTSPSIAADWIKYYDVNAVSSLELK